MGIYWGYDPFTKRFTNFLGHLSGGGENGLVLNQVLVVLVGGST